MAPTSAAALVRSIFAGLVLLVSGTSAYSGEGTAYGHAGGRGRGACDIRKNLGKYETYYASMNEHQYRSSDCGKCIKVCGKRGCVEVMLVDKCMGCKHGDVDMSSVALKASTGYSWDRKPITWGKPYNCGSGGGSSTSSNSRSNSKSKSRSSKNKRYRKCKRKCKGSRKKVKRCRNRCRRRIYRK